MLSQKDAKNRFDAVVDAALAGHPQTVLPWGKPAVMVVAAVECNRLLRAAKANREIFVDHLLAFPADTVPRANASPKDVGF